MVTSPFQRYLKTQFLSDRNMKKIFVTILSIIFISAAMVSCHVQHERCAAYGKIKKIDTGKSFIDKTVKSI